jgi:hypothetical protein
MPLRLSKRCSLGKPRVMQNHHISYDPEIVVRIYKGEHELLTKLNLYSKKTLSKGFIKSLKVWIALNEDRAKDLELQYSQALG